MNTKGTDLLFTRIDLLLLQQLAGLLDVCVDNSDDSGLVVVFVLFAGRA